MEKITFLEQLPEAVSQLLSDVNDLKELLLQFQAADKPSEDKPLTIVAAAELTSLSKHTIYRLVQAKAIPHFKKNKRLYFERDKLIAWLRDERQ